MKRVSLVPPTRPVSDRSQFVRVAPVVDIKKPVKGKGVIPPLRGGYITPPSPGPRRVAGRKLGVDELLAAAELLEPGERKQLLDRLALNRTAAHRSGDDRDREMWVVAVYEGLAASNGLGDGAAQGPGVVRRFVGTPAAWAPVAEFMNASKLLELDVAERQAVYRMLAGLVIARAAAIGEYSKIPLGAKLVATSAAQITAIFNQAFPGYLASGLARVVAGQLTNPRGL